MVLLPSEKFAITGLATFTVNCSAPLEATRLVDSVPGSENFCGDRRPVESPAQHVNVSRMRPGSGRDHRVHRRPEIKNQRMRTWPDLLVEAEPDRPNQQPLARLQLHGLREHAQQQASQGGHRHKPSAAEQQEIQPASHMQNR